MKKLILHLVLVPLFIFAQSDKKLQKIYGGIPTSNENMSWIDDSTPDEKYIGVIKIDTAITKDKVIEAFMITFQPLQDANIMTKQMRTNSAIGSVAAALNNDYDAVSDFVNDGDADSRKQNLARSSWTVQFIDGVRISRFYYNVNVQVKDGRYRLSVIPAGTGGYANDHVQTTWSQLFKNGQIKPIYSKYYDQMKIKLAYTIDQWINNVDEYLNADLNEDW